MANITRYDDLNTGAIAYATLVSCILLLVIILLLRALTCAWVEAGVEAKMADAHYYSSDAEISEQKAQISGYEEQEVVVTPSNDDGTSAQPRLEERYRIPVARAKEVLLDELKSQSTSDKDA